MPSLVGGGVKTRLTSIFQWHIFSPHMYNQKNIHAISQNSVSHQILKRRVERRLWGECKDIVGAGRRNDMEMQN